MYKASCLCGSIQLTINSDLSDFGYCHCRSCQKASGSAFGANAGVERDAVIVQDSGNTLNEYESSPGKFRAFCSHCGSPIFAYISANPHLIRIRLGLLDTPFSKRCQAHSFVSEKASWETITDAVPKFDNWADPTVLVQVGSRQTLQHD